MADRAQDSSPDEIARLRVALARAERNERLLRSVAVNAPGLVFRRIDGPGREQRFDFIEGRLLERFGVTSAEAMGNPATIWRHFEPASLREARRAIERSLVDLRPYGYTARLRLRPSDETVWIEVSATPHRQDDGSVATDGIAVDVTRRVAAETDAREQRALLQQLVDAMPAAINVKDREGRMIIANRALADYYGAEPEDLLWTAPDQILDPPDEEETTRRWDLEVLRSGRVSPAREYAYVDRHGEVRHWLSRKSPLRHGETGEIDHVVTVSLDISDRVLAEQRAHEAEVRLGSIVENLPGMILRRRHRPDGGIDYIYAAGRMAAELGFTPDGKPTPRTWGDMLPEDRTRLEADLRRMVETMSPLVAINRYVAADGTIRWTQNFSQPRRLEDGTVVSDAILLDVTDRMSAEERARQRDALLRSVAASIPGAVLRWRVDPSGRVRQEFAAGRFVELGQIVDRPGLLDIADLWPVLEPEDGRRLAEELAETGARRGAVELDVRARLDDETRWIRIFGSSRTAVEDLSAWDLVLIDATESKRYEEQLRIAQKMDAIGNLTGGIAHDFNNVLAVIVANLDLLLDARGLGAEERQLADAALRAAERGADLTGHLLAFARNRPEEPVSVDCAAQVDGFARLMRRGLGPEIELEIRRDEALPRVTVDAAQLETALMNLVVNARDAMDGRGRIILEMRNAVFEIDDVRPGGLAPGRYVALAVTDFGSGMSAEVQRRAFEPLFTTKIEGRGTGFGLPMVYGFARRAGGLVTLYSEPGHGTTVRMYLPAGTGGSEPLGPEPPPCAPVGTEGATVLLVDDNHEARRALASQLRRHGYAVIEATDAVSALTCAAGQPDIDLLVTDIVMPGELNGVELADRLLQGRPDLPILLTSGYPSDALADRRLAQGRYELLEKPFRQRDLLAAVGRLLGAAGR